MSKIIGVHNHVKEQGDKQNFLNEVMAQNANVISITDHRTLISYYNLFNNLTKEEREQFKGLRFVIGMELTGMFPYTTLSKIESAIPMDILAYNIDIEKYAKLYKFIQEKYSRIAYMDSATHQQEELEFLISVAKKLGYKADYDKMKIDADHPFAAATLSYGLIDEKYLEHNLKNGLLPELITNPRGFKNRELKNPDSPFFVDSSEFYPDVKDVIDSIHDVSGLVFVPHTAAYYAKAGGEERIKSAWENSYKFTTDFLEAHPEINGIEIKHPCYMDNVDFYNFLVAIAKKKGLFVSGGTDYHKPGEPITTDYSGEYITDQVLYNFNDWAKLYTIDEIIELGRMVYEIENKEQLIRSR